MPSSGLLQRIWRARTIYLFISPFFILFAIFQFFPLVWSFYMSFHEWNGLGPMEPIGLQNYRVLLRDEVFHTALGNTVIYWLANGLLILPLALLLANFLAMPHLAGRRLMRSVMFLPYVTATVAVGLIFNMIFDFNSGLVNSLLNAVGLPSVPWLTSVEISKLPVIFLNVWRLTPWYTLILLSGLQGMNPELHEAATVDGAGPVQRFFSITIPVLMPILFFCFITLTIDSFRIFTEPYILTQGGPGNLRHSPLCSICTSTASALGLASAIGYALTFILLIVSAAQIVLLLRQSGLTEVN